MSRIVAIAVWLLISAYAFYVLRHPKPGRERTGRSLVGIGALLVAGVLAIPELNETYNAGDVLSVVGITLAGVCLGIGLILAFPGAGFGQDAPPTDDPPQEEE